MSLYRYKLTIEYDGTPFHGFQYQLGLPSVQGELEKVLPYINKGDFAKVYVAGRTDTGVHAIGQVAHVDLKTNYESFKVLQALNQQLRKNLKEQTISVTNVEHVDKNFHARFSAQKRFYLYRIINRIAPTALNLKRAWHIYTPLNIASMNEAAQFLKGHHDFTSFRSIECQSPSPIRTLDELSITEKKEFIEVKVSSKSFLHHQVRNIVGTLKLVGQGKWSPNHVKKVLEAKDRRTAGPTAPPYGLYLTDVQY